MRQFWLRGAATTRQKLVVYDAVVRAKLLYGLQAAHLTDRLLKKLDTFHLKGLRHRAARCHGEPEDHSPFVALFVESWQARGPVACSGLWPLSSWFATLALDGLTSLLPLAAQ